MEIVDKESERIAAEQTPEGRKKKLIKQVVLGIAVVVFLAYVDLDSHHPAFIGTPHPVIVAGFTIEPGKTTVQELSSAGFQLSAYDKRGTGIRIYNLLDELDAKSYYMNMDLTKDDKKYAKIEIVNESSSSKMALECKVRSVMVFNSDTDAEQSSIDGVSGADISIDALTKAAGEPKSSRTDDGETTVIWKKGYYSMKFVIKEDGSGYHYESRYEKD